MGLKVGITCQRIFMSIVLICVWWWIICFWLLAGIGTKCVVVEGDYGSDFWWDCVSRECKIRRGAVGVVICWGIEIQGQEWVMHIRLSVIYFCLCCGVSVLCSLLFTISYFLQLCVAYWTMVVFSWNQCRKIGVVSKRVFIIPRFLRKHAPSGISRDEMY